MLGDNEVRLTAPWRPRIIQLRTMHQQDQAGGLPLTFGEIGKPLIPAESPDACSS
jgi:hypothetical protein